MRKEIFEQPEALRLTFENVSKNTDKIKTLWKEKQCKRIITLARGSSANAASFAQFIFADLANIQAQPQSVEVAIDFQAELDLSNVLAIAVSQSGETKETIAALEWAKSNGAITLAISNNPDSRLEQIADLAISTLAGNEIAIPATKSYSTALMVLATIAAALGEKPAALKELAQVPAIVENAITKINLVESLKVLATAKTMICCGSGYSENTANEAALKFRETCYINAIGISAAELQHGTKALFDEEESFLIFTSGQTHPANTELEVLANRAFENGVRPIVFGNFPKDERYTHIYSEDNWSLLTSTFVLVAQAQVLVEELAVKRGLSPDTPRSLSKITQLES